MFLPLQKGKNKGFLYLGEALTYSAAQSIIYNIGKMYGFFRRLKTVRKTKSVAFKRLLFLLTNLRLCDKLI